MEKDHEVLTIIWLPHVLKFFSHAVHAFIIDDDNVEVIHYLSNEDFVVYAFDNLRTNTPAKFVPFLNNREFSENLFWMVLRVLRISPQQQE